MCCVNCGNTRVPGHSAGIVTGGSAQIPIVEHRPDNISVYLVQENELMTVANGGDTLPQQVALLFGGAVIGGLPGAFSAYSQYQQPNGRPDVGSIVAFVLVVAGVVVILVCAAIHRRHKTYPQRVLGQILSRKNCTESPHP
jgi:hypothetical protein